jgi:hypothetical protein
LLVVVVFVVVYVDVHVLMLTPMNMIFDQPGLCLPGKDRLCNHLLPLFHAYRGQEFDYEV